MTQRPSDTISTERLEKALQTLAYIVVRHGEQYACLMEWVDEELQRRRSVPSASERAQRILRGAMQEARQHA